MKKHKPVFFLAIICLVFGITSRALAGWYAGWQRSFVANGITALISAPLGGVNLIQIPTSGISNWVSTYNNDANGKDWIQAGWRFYYWYSVPNQYVEWCIDCSGENGIYEIREQIANHAWGSSIDYWVTSDGSSRWCAYTEMVVRFCVNNLHPSPSEVIVKSEVHATPMNPLDTEYDQIRY